MAAFVAKQMVGNKLSAVKGAVGGDGDDSDDKEKEEEAERERQEAIKEAEDRRKEKHRKMEEEREKMRQEIRDKYKIPKKEEVVEQQPMEPDNPLMRKKKTPEELAAEAELEDQDEFTKLKNTIETQVNELKSQIESKCVMQWVRGGGGAAAGRRNQHVYHYINLNTWCSCVKVIVTMPHNPYTPSPLTPRRITQTLRSKTVSFALKHFCRRDSKSFFSERSWLVARWCLIMSNNIFIHS